MPEMIHIFELPVEVEPFRPGVQRRASLVSHVVVSTAAVAFRAGIAAARAKLLEDLSRPPVKMGVDDPHGIYRQIITHPTLQTGSPGCCILSLIYRPHRSPGEQLDAHHWRAFSSVSKRQRRRP